MIGEKMIYISELLEKLNNEYKLNINNKENYKKAFTHSSYVNENKKYSKSDDYERLEFLGDAVLEVSTSEFLYKKFPDLTEGELTKIRSSLVCELSLVRETKKLNFSKYILLGKGEEKNGGRCRASLLADIFEAFLGALYLDKGLDSVKKFLDNTLFKEVKTSNYHVFIDYKTLLQEYYSHNNRGVIRYDLISSSGPSHEKIFEIALYVNEKNLGKGKSRTKKEAEQLAAKEVLTKLKLI
ncbi:ribonuclease III [Gemelliphila asaccharolytica]|uniref:Ribonuclease 3 n=2 Tax=Gemelliphila asaccharolytica TaxID=502393 RepID=A0ABR5TMV9_9BACL|nr:ribonuclease III [Gemella asaccharolytica]